MIVNDELKILENETIDQYKLRICGCKDEYNLTWDEVADIINQNTQLNTTGGACRKYYAYHKNDTDIDYLTTQKERVKLRDERIQINSLVRTLAREETLKEIAQEAVNTISSHKILETPSPERLQCLSDKTYENKCATLILSDWHYGVDIDSTYNKYNPDVDVERIDTLRKRVV